MTNRIYATIGICLLCAAAFLWFALGSSHLRQYEVVAPGILYRASVSSLDNFIDAEAKVSPAYILMGVRDKEDKSEPWPTITLYAFRNHIRIGPFRISPDGTIPDDQIDRVLGPTGGKRLPVLVVSADGAASGMIAAAYRLRIEKMPLDQVEELAQLPDAPADTTRRIREFARAYDKTLRAGAGSAGEGEGAGAGAGSELGPTTAPSTNTATN